MNYERTEDEKTSAGVQGDISSSRLLYALGYARGMLHIVLIGLSAVIVAALFQLLLAPRLSAQTPNGTFGYILIVGTDTLGVERVTVQDGHWSGDIVIRNQGRILWTAPETGRGQLGPLELRAFKTPADTTPFQVVRISVRSDSGHVERIVPAAMETIIPSKRGAFVLIGSSIAMLELLVDRVQPGASATIPLFLAQGGQTVEATLQRTRDSAVLVIAGQTSTLSLDAAGAVRSGRTAAQNLAFVRLEGTALARVSIGVPSYAAPADAPYSAQDVRIPTSEGRELAGTLTRPKSGPARVPVVVTITGSGPQDRDELISIVRGYRPFRQIADTLGRSGIAVLRYDDRGYGASTGNFSAATSADFADDARSAIAWLRARPDIDPDRIFVLGHSEGGLIAPMLAATDPRIAGIVLLAGPAQSGRQIIYYQQRYAIDHDTGLKTAAARDSAAAHARIKFDSDSRATPWLKFFAAYDPVPTARKVHAPALILQGGNDMQVTPGQASTLAAAFREGGNKNVGVKVFPGLNHLFLVDPDGNPANYSSLRNGAIGSDVLGEIVAWVKQRGTKSDK